MTGRLLIVDDSATNRIELKSRLAAAFYATLQADSGLAALRVAREEAPDAILLDLDLPDIDGISVCRQLRADPMTRTIPVLLLTENGNPEARLAALAAGADDFLTKPIDDQLLLARLRSLLRARETEAELSLREVTGRTLGFAEETPSFGGPALVALIAATPQQAIDWRNAVAPVLPHRLIMPHPEVALAGPETPDVFVIFADLRMPGDGLRLMSELRARPSTRHAEMCIVLPPGRRDLAAMALDLGANDLVIAPFDPRELALRLETLVRRKRLADRLRASLRDNMRLSVRDPLTGLHNRRYAMPHLGHIAARATQSGRSFAAMLLDIDRFKSVNDRFSHAAGDAVLVEVARRLADNLRAVDLLARIGGEEFLVVLPDTDLSEARAAAERLCRVVELRPIALPGGGAVPITVSIGLAIGNGPPAQEVLNQADLALMQAKAEGRNQVMMGMNAA